MKTLALSLAVAAGPLWAESPIPPEPTPAKAYQSAFADYRPIQDETILDWRATNDEMGRLRGHMGHLEAAPTRQEGEVGHAHHGTKPFQEGQVKP
ncbi:hypothetical protein [Azonexus fungiphilus]|uniref:hypothetical protein n=1 Tax=Azonexus fungiphilus TaxID=146940 RepID=UPI00156B8238|nr:hypothetical protein [Azonexus fungiphilus]NHC08288.1 hypothetical protein [Azonexus fungiphilus]